jgi:DNA-binding NarL/FixJ family response regulator
MPGTLHDPRVRPVRVLTVDDHIAFRDAARTLVSSTPGFEIAGESSTGQAALQLAREVDPDIVLVDMRMTGLDGIETARRLHAEDPSRVIVLVSSADVSDLSELAAASGVAAILRKHWLTPRLLRGLWLALRRR